MISVSDEFNQLAAGPVRPLDWRTKVSFTKARNQDISWFTLNQSVLDGSDLLAESDDNPIQLWDAYDYQDISDRIVSMDITRSIEFPNNIQSAIADFSLNNYDGYLSIAGAGGSSPISQYILPKRPCRLYLGFKGGGVAPQFVGLTQGVPNYSGQKDELASFTAMDFLSEIGDMQLNQMVMMRDARTDEVIAEILNQFGIESQMYNLDKGLNIIPFVYFESGKNAGNALAELVQAENGSMWLDEQGVIRFAPKTAIIGKTPQMVFDGSNTIDIKPSREAQVINVVKLSTEIRTIQPLQPVFTQDNSNGYASDASEDSYRVKANGSAEIWLNFEDPVWSANALVLNGNANDSNFQAVNLSGVPVNSNVSATGELFATSYKLTLTNTNNFPVSVSFLELWGQPAKMIGGQAVEYQAEESDSVTHYGPMVKEITDNNCFGSIKNARQYANDILGSYSDYSSVIELQVKGNPALMLNDVISIDYPNYVGNYIITGISHRLTDSKLETTMTVRKTSLYTPFILDMSVLNGEDVLG